MRKRLATFCLVLTAILFGVSIAGAYWQSRQQIIFAGGFTPTCSESSAWFSREASNGTTLSDFDKIGHDPFICGLVTDGVFADLNFLYSFVTASPSTQGLLNIISSSFTISVVGSPTWTANGGVTGGTGIALNTNFTPSTDGGSLMSLNDIGMGVCILTNRTTNQDYISIGAETNTAAVSQTYLVPFGTPSASYSGLNSAVGSGVASTTRSTAQGLWTSASDANASLNKIYQGASDVTSGAYGAVRTSLSDQTLYILAYHDFANGIKSESFDKHAIAFGGKSLTGAKVTSLQGRLATLLSYYTLSGC